MAAKVKNVVISGYYGFGNSGDEALLHSILLALEQEAQKHDMVIVPVVLSVSPKATEQMHGVKAIHRTNLFQIINCIRKSDGLISGGGSLLQDMTGRTTIPYYLGIIKLAQLLGKPTFIYSQGIGPIFRDLFHPFIRNTFNNSQYISVRDAESVKILQGIGVKTDRIEIVSDPVLGLPLKPIGGSRRPAGVNAADSRPAEGKADAVPIIGISVRFWNRYRKDLNLLTVALRSIMDQSAAHLRFLPFHPPADLEASEYVIHKLGPQYQRRLTIVAGAGDPQDMLYQVSACDLIIGMRLHSLIYAAAYAIPMIGISYDPKIDHFLNSMEMKATASTEHLDPGLIAREALALLKDREGWVQSKQHLIDQIKNKSQQAAQQICHYLRNKG